MAAEISVYNFEQKARPNPILHSDGGYLTKRITNIVNESRIEFEIIEQSIRYQDSINYWADTLK